MDRLLYVAMTGAKQLMQAQALVANNLANVATSGFVPTWRVSRRAPSKVRAIQAA